MTEIKNNLTQPTEETTKSSEENYKSLKAITEALDTDFTKFQGKKVKASGNRVRNNLLNIKKLCDVLRKQILVDIKEIPTKHRINTEDKKPETLEPKTPEPEPLEPEPLELVRETTEMHKDLKKVKKPRKPRKTSKTRLTVANNLNPL
jgi:hypothetical protein